MRRPLYIDLETDIKNRGEDAIGTHKASPYHPDNQIVWSGNSTPTMLPEVMITKGAPNMRVFLAGGDIIVGQNLSFDLQYLMKSDYNNFMHELQTKTIWDVMIAEYLLTGQRVKWASLDDLSSMYGGVLKDDKIKEYWEKDVDTHLIPEYLIHPYLVNDVRNLDVIYRGQLEQAAKLNMLDFIKVQMEARLATIIMEYHGMAFDKLLAITHARTLQAIYNRKADELISMMYLYFDGHMPKEQINPNSNPQLSAFLFGGFITVREEVQILDADGVPVTYKSGPKKGDIRTKMVDVPYSVRGITKSPNPPKTNGVFDVSADTLKRVNVQEAEAILELRGLQKQISTYFNGYSELVFPDGCIHPSINHCQTDTGRLSSSKPNLQNVNNKSSEIEE